MIDEIPEAFLYQCWKPGLHCTYASVHEDHRPDEKWTHVYRHPLWYVENGGNSQELIDGTWVDVDPPQHPKFPDKFIGQIQRHGVSALHVDDTMMLNWMSNVPSAIITQTESGVTINLDPFIGQGRTLRDAIADVILQQENEKLKPPVVQNDTTVTTYPSQYDNDLRERVPRL